MHINRDLLMAFYQGDVSAPELLRLAQEHLLGQCPYCRREFEAFCTDLHTLEGAAGGVQAGDDEFFPHDDTPRPLETRDCLLTLTQSPEFQAALPTARRWYRELERLPEAQQLQKVKRARSRFRGRTFGFLMLQQARQAIPGDARRALHLARLAQLATFLEEKGKEIHALALAHQANAHRVLGQDEEALRLFDMLQDCMYPVTDTRTVAEVASLEGSMAFDHRHFSDAASRFTRAISLYRLLQDCEGEALNLLKLGSNSYHTGNTHEAVTLTRAALQLLVDEESDLYLGARHNLGVYLVASGAGEEVAQMLAQDLPLYRQRARETPQWNALCLWLSGKVAATLGDSESAERLFVETRHIFNHAGQAYDAALVGLDLIHLYLGQQRLTEMVTLADTMLPVFTCYELAPEIRELIAAFELALQKQQVGVRLLRRLTRRLEHAGRKAR